MSDVITIGRLSRVGIDGEVRSAVAVGGGSVATTTHHGPYHLVAPAHHTLMGQISERGHEMTRFSLEIYLDDPTHVAEEDLRTQVDWPID